MKRWLMTAALASLALSACEPGAPAPDEAAVEAISAAAAERLYLSRCAICHGVRGDGHGPRWRSLHSKPPDFRRAAWRRGKSLEAIRRVIGEGSPTTDMPAWKSLDAAQIAGLAEYVLELGKPASTPGDESGA